MKIGVRRAKIHVAGEYPVWRAVRDIVKLSVPDDKGVTHQGFVIHQGLALLVTATSEHATVWYHCNIPARRIRALIEQERRVVEVVQC